MKTELLPASDAVIKKAADLVKAGDVVAIPTETVYGIAGNAYDGEAVKKIFLAKGRPQDNPLIVHIDTMERLYEVAAVVPKDALKLAAAFWPGPLTMVLKKSERVSLTTTAGLGSVGVRMPKNEWARKLITLSNVPFAAPSANLSGKPSPTNAGDVFADMDGRLPLIVDGGESDAGVESTVVSLLENTPVLLRPGVITKEQMESVLGKPVAVAGAVLERLKDGETARSPGMKYKHYAPNATVKIVRGDFCAYQAFLKKQAITEDGVFALCFTGEGKSLPVPYVEYGREEKPEEQAHALFTALRELDKRGAKTVYARAPKTDGVALAVFNRLLRAAAFCVIDL